MSDFTFNEFHTGILKFNDENVMHIGFNSDTEDIIITNWNAAANTHKTLQTNLNGGGGADLGQKTITANGTYDASDDGLDGYDQVTVNVTGISIDDIATGAVPTGDLVLSSAASIMSYAFAFRTAITSVTAPACTEIKEHCFFRCTGITSVTFPSLTTFYNAGYAFDGCTSLTSVNVPSFSGEVDGRVFNNCSALAVIDLHDCTKIKAQAFNGTSSLRTMILRKSDNVCTLDAANATAMGGIYSHPDESTIYVPSALKSTYEQATNWSALYALGVTFTPIEGSVYE